VNNNPVPPEIVIPQPQSQQLSSPQSQRRFDLAQAGPFIYKSVSEETRVAYRRGIHEFFQFVGGVHPSLVTPTDVIACRDHLRIKKQRKANTIATKLAIVRSFFDYLRAGGVISLNPASIRLVPPPEPPTEPRGRARTPKGSGANSRDRGHVSRCRGFTHAEKGQVKRLAFVTCLDSGHTL
jgi:hypothetical protein